MSSEIFDRNIGELVKRGALRPDAARARERFLGAVAAPPERRSWAVAAAAAAVLVAATIVWSAKPGNSPVEPPLVMIPPPPVLTRPAPLPGNDLLRAELKLPSGTERRPTYHFIGKSTLPDGLIFKIRVHRMIEEFSGGSLKPLAVDQGNGTVELEKGLFDYDWAASTPGPLRLEVSAPDGFQEKEMVRTIKVKEAERTWAFEYAAWDDKLRDLLEPQLSEIADLSIEALKLIDRCESLVVNEELFKARMKEVSADAQRLQVRTNHFASKSLYPASLREIEYTVRTLSTLLQYFRWTDGKFAGPNSYYNNGKGDLTHRNEAFAFNTLRRYLEEAVQAGGREFCLWVLKDVRRAGFQEAHRSLVKSQKHKPGVEPFAERLMNISAEDLAALEATLRKP